MNQKPQFKVNSPPKIFRINVSVTTVGENGSQIFRLFLRNNQWGFYFWSSYLVLSYLSTYLISLYEREVLRLPLRLSPPESKTFFVLIGIGDPAEIFLLPKGHYLIWARCAESEGQPNPAQIINKTCVHCSVWPWNILFVFTQLNTLWYLILIRQCLQRKP